jgi:hypothetical protein
MGVRMTPIPSNRFIGFSAWETVETVVEKIEMTDFPHDESWG